MKKDWKEFWKDVDDTIEYGRDKPLDFVYESVRGTYLLVKGCVKKEPSMPRLYDDRCKRCAKLALTGLLALGTLLGTAKVYRKNKTTQPMKQPVMVEMDR